MRHIIDNVSDVPYLNELYTIEAIEIALISQEKETQDKAHPPYTERNMIQSAANFVEFKVITKVTISLIVKVHSIELVLELAIIEFSSLADEKCCH